MLVHIPDECALLILELCSARDLAELGRVSRRWRRLANDWRLWRRHVLDGGWPAKPSDSSWKRFFVEQKMMDTCFESGEPSVATLVPHRGAVTCLEVTGDRLVSAADDSTIRVWSLERRTQIHGGLNGHSGAVWALQADGCGVASGGYDRTVKLWDLETGVCQRTLRGHRNWIFALQMDERKIVSGSWDHSIRVWDRARGDQLALVEAGEAVYALNLIDNGTIAAGHAEGRVCVFDLETKATRLELPQAHSGHVYSVQAQDGLLYSAGRDKCVRAWDPRIAGDQSVLELQLHAGPVMALRVCGTRLISGGYDKAISIADLRQGGRLLQYMSANTVRVANQANSPVFSVALQGFDIVSGTADGKISIWSMRGRREWRVMRGIQRMP